MKEIFEFEIIVTETIEEVPPSNPVKQSSSRNSSTGLLWAAIVTGGLVLFTQIAALALWIGKEYPWP